MLAAPDAGHNHMQVVDFLRINFRQHAREEIGLFLVVAFQHNPVAGASRFSSTLTNWSVGMTLPGMFASASRRCFSVRRRFQTRPVVCSAFINNLLIRQIVLFVLVEISVRREAMSIN